MFNSRSFLLLLFALVCFLEIVHNADANPVETDVQKKNTLQGFYEDASKTMTDILKQLKEASEKNGWSDEAGKVMNKLKGLMDSGSTASP